jgi:phosphatidylglycerophosphate synthase
MSETKRGYGDLLKIPNLVTMFRVLLAFAFFLFIHFGHTPGNRTTWYILALGTFLLAAATDWLDGFLARKYDMETAFGRIADPFVDKLLVCGAFILFAFYLKGNPYLRSVEGTAGTQRYLVNVAIWMVIVIVGREFLISTLRGYAESRNVKFGANVWGKQKMIFQSAAICAILLHQAALNYHVGFAIGTTILLWLAVGWTLLSGILYIQRAARVLSNGPA